MSELLSPAASPQHMHYAFAYGADAVYGGLPRHSLRVRGSGFDSESLPLAIENAHRLQKKFYLVSNGSPHNRKLHTYLDDLRPVCEAGPDAIICADPGVIHLLQTHFPDIPLHLSVQANTINYGAVDFWARAGINRIILSRELELSEIREIRERCPKIELEVFVHGALCMAHSGRCLLSGYINRRDANQGTCTNNCRWGYHVHEATLDETGDIVPLYPIALLEETSRKGTFLPAFEDESGTYILNSKDLCALEQVPALVEMGVHSLKIEGRTKSPYYVARTAGVYRRAIDAGKAKKPLSPALRDSLEMLSNRGYTEGFLRRHAPQDTQLYTHGFSDSKRGRLVATFHTEKGLWVVNNKLKEGRLSLLSPTFEGAVHVLSIHQGDTRLLEAPGSGYEVALSLTHEGRPLSKEDCHDSFLIEEKCDGTIY